jgi:site-specific DNA-methyltransferase (adenine-specific)
MRYELVRSDAFEWLEIRKACSIHGVVTDPPFGLVEYTAVELSKRLNGGGGIWRLPRSYDGYKRLPAPRFTVLTRRDLDEIERFHSRLAPLLYKVLVPGGHVIIASQNLISHMVSGSFCRSGFEVRGQIARIVKTFRGGDRPKSAHDVYPDISVSPRSCWEPWMIFRKPCEGLVKDNLKKWGTGGLRRPHRERPFMDVISASPARGREREMAPHPSLKPQVFMRLLVSAVLPLGRGVILDPFMGSGATIAAAEAVKLRSIGLEMNEEYFRMAKKAVPQLASLVWSPPGGQRPKKPGSGRAKNGRQA